jgi:hypothetical protein
MRTRWTRHAEGERCVFIDGFSRRMGPVGEHRWGDNIKTYLMEWDMATGLRIRRVEL